MDLNKLVKSQWDRTAAIVLSALGAIALLIGWIGVSGTPLLAEQAPYILSGGVGGVFLLGLGATLWISADLRDEWRKLDRIEAAIGEGTLRWDEGTPSVETPRTSRVDAPRLPAAEDFLDSAPTVSANGHAKVARTPATAGTARRTATPARPRAKASTNDA